MKTIAYYRSFSFIACKSGYGVTNYDGIVSNRSMSHPVPDFYLDAESFLSVKYAQPVAVERFADLDAKLEQMENPS